MCLRSVIITSAVSLIAAMALADHPAPLKVENSDAKTEAEMKAYTELIEHTDAKFEMLPIKGGKFLMGSPESEKGRKEDEGPRHKVEISPFWMAKCEITWDAYEVWMADLDIVRRQALGFPSTERDKLAESFQISRPTKPYTDMTFKMGKKGYPAICMTQHACRVYCDWLSAKTGRYYRLPTEAEWEYACRAGTKTAYSFGDDPSMLGEHAWYYDNSHEKYAKVGTEKPNPWGLHDMHGNVQEWVLDQHTADFYGQCQKEGTAKDPLRIPLEEYGRSVRGGSWDADAQKCRSAARELSIEDWKQQDPQVPQSIYYFTDALNLGFRIVRPLSVPSTEERVTKWDKSEPPQIDKEPTVGE